MCIAYGANPHTPLKRNRCKYKADLGVQSIADSHSYDSGHAGNFVYQAQLLPGT